MGGECELCVQCGGTIWGNEDDLFVCGECGWETDSENCLMDHFREAGWVHDDLAMERFFEFPDGEYASLEEW